MVDSLAYGRQPGSGGHISRRVFLKGVGMVVAGSALMTIGYDRLAAARIPALLASAPTLVRSTFASHLGDTFHIRLGSSNSLALQLFKVRDLRAASKSAAAVADPEQSFSLLFRGPSHQPLSQETYQFEHDRVGGFALLIAPMRPEEDSRYYEAIFNRLSA
jgi:hypothetical protein